MNVPLHLDAPGRRSVVAAGLAVGAVAGVVAWSMTGSAQAGDDRPAITVNTVLPTFQVTLPPLTFVTIPPTLLTLPPLTFGTAPDSTATTEAMTTTVESTALATTTSTTGAPPAEEDDQAPPVPEFGLAIDVAQIECDGTIHVEYHTTGEPAPATPANHIVMYNPTSLPTDFHVVETTGNDANGSFVFDDLGVTDLTYRVLVIGLFDEATPDGPKAIDQADVALVAGC